MQKGNALIFLLVGIFVIAIAGGAYYLGRLTTPKTLSVPVPISQTSQSTPIPSSTSTLVDETANWKTYTNSKYGFSFKYPDDLSFTPSNNTDKSSEVEIYAYNPHDYAEVALVVSHKSESTLIQEDGENLTKSIIDFNGISADKYSGNSGVAGTVYKEEVFFTHNSLTFIFSVGTYNRKNLLIQILSTFKFTQ